MRPDGDLRQGRWQTWCLLAIILLGMSLSLYQLAKDSLWMDEIVTALYAREPTLSDALHRLDTKSGRPLYFVLAYLVAALGQGEFLLRLPSVAAGILGLVATYKVGQILLARPEGLIAAFLLALSPLYLQYSQEARAYALFTFLSMLSLYCFLRAWESGQWRWWAGFAAVSALNTYTHYFSIFVLAAEFLFAAILLLHELMAAWQAEAGERRQGWLHARRQTLFLLLSALIIGLAFVPSLGHAQGFLNKQATGTALAQGIDPSAGFFVGLWRQFAGGSAQAGQSSAYVWLVTVLLVGGLVGMALRRQGKALLLVGLWIVLPFVALFTIPTRHFFHVRFVLFMLPLLLLVVARGTTALAGLVRLAIRWPAGQSVLAGVAWPLFFLCFGLLSVAPLSEYYAQEKEDWRGAAAYLRAHIQPGDLILCDGARRGGGADSDRTYKALRYYLPQAFAEQALFLQEQSAGYIAPIAQENRAVWGVVYGGLRKNETEGNSVTRTHFKDVTIFGTQDAPGTLLDRSILLSQALLSSLRGQARLDVYLQLGRFYALRGEQDLAREQYVQALSLVTDPLEAAALYHKLGDLENAEASYRRALAQDPRQHQVHFELGKLYEEMNEPELALQEYGRASELSPQFPGYYVSVGRVHAQLGEQEAAEKSFLTAIELDPQNGWYRMLLANALLALDRPQQALDEYAQALVLNPDYQQNAWYHLQRGRACRLAGRTEEAIAAYEQVLMLDDDNEEAARWLRELQ